MSNWRRYRTLHAKPPKTPEINPPAPPAGITDPEEFLKAFHERPEIKRALARRRRGWGHYYDLY